jgi:hypothetical protein
LYRYQQNSNLGGVRILRRFATPFIFGAWRTTRSARLLSRDNPRRGTASALAADSEPFQTQDCFFKLLLFNPKILKDPGYIHSLRLPNVIYALFRIRNRITFAPNKPDRVLKKNLERKSVLFRFQNTQWEKFITK